MRVRGWWEGEKRIICYITGLQRCLWLSCEGMILQKQRWLFRSADRLYKRSHLRNVAAITSIENLITNTKELFLIFFSDSSLLDQIKSKGYWNVWPMHRIWTKTSFKQKDAGNSYIFAEVIGLCLIGDNCLECRTRLELLFLHNPHNGTVWYFHTWF